MVVGKWTLEDYQSLFDLVNADLRLKTFEERKTRHRMVCSSIPSPIYLIIFIFFVGSRHFSLHWADEGEHLVGIYK